MKHFKKIIAVTAIALAAFTVSAQTSNTSSATNAIFKTDVDKFMDVNLWSTVKPEKAFTYLGVSYSTYNLGFAKQFKKFYSGTYFTGDFGNYEKTVTKTSADTITVINEGNTEGTSFTLYNLFGIGNLGIKLGFYYYNNNSTKSESSASTDITDNSRFTIYTTVGSKEASLGKIKLAPYARFNFLMNGYNNSKNPNTNISMYGTKKVTAGVTTADDRIWAIQGGVGATTSLVNSSTNNTTLHVYVGTRIENPMNKDFLKTEYFLIQAPVELKSVYHADKQFSFGVRAVITPQFIYNKTSEIEKTNTLKLDNSLYAGLQYDTLKKLVFNAGVEFRIPDYSLEFASNSSTDTKKTTSSWNGSDAYVSFSSGFQFNPVKNLCFDCTFGILPAIFISDDSGGDLTTDLDDTGNTDFWKNVGQVIVHNISLKVSYKF